MPAPLRPLDPRSYPALVLAGCLGTGIVSARVFPNVGFAVWTSVALGAGVLVVLALGLRHRRLVSLGALGATLSLGVLFTAAGGARLALWDSLPADHVAHLAEATETPLVLTGTVEDHPTASERSLRFVLAADSLLLPGETLPVRGSVQATLWQPRDPDEAFAFPHLAAGHRVRLEGTLRPHRPRRNPAEFDYGAYLARRGIHATLSLSDSASLVVTAEPAGFADRLANTARAYVRRTLEAHVRTDEASAVLAALLLADRSRIDTATRETFAVTGLMHLLAISGLHVLLVGMGLYGFLKPVLHRLRWSWRRVEVVRAVVTIGLLGVYVLTTGAPPSAVRALVMATLLIVGAAMERAPNSLNALGVAACMLLIARPTALFDAGFQLSFAAVGGIVLLKPVFERPLPEVWREAPVSRWVVEMTLVSLGATLGTLPVLLYHFGRVPLAGLVLNLAAIPATFVTLGGGLIAVATAGWAPFVADLAGASAEAGALALLTLSRWGAEWLAWSNLGQTVRDGWVLASLVAALVALALSARPRLRWRVATLALALAAVAVWQPVWSGSARPSLQVLFFDVGQGDAALVSLPNDRHLLVDAGLRDPFTDAGVRTLLPHLRAAGIDRLDAVVISHPHADHLGGLPALLRAIPVAQVVHNGHNYASDLFAETVAETEARGVTSRAVTAGDTLALDDAVRIHVLGPSAAPHPEEEANHGSVVLRVTYGTTSFLFMGDAEAEAEADLVAHYGDLLASDVVKVGHHGSRTSSTPAFVDRAVGNGAATAVVSVAQRNVYRLPNAEVLERWDDAGATVLQTWAEGAVWLRSDGHVVERRFWR